MHLHHNGGSVRGASASSGSLGKDVPQWWNGRRAGFKILFRKECPFESGLGHHFLNNRFFFERTEPFCLFFVHMPDLLSATAG